MTPKQTQTLFDSAICSTLAWKRKASQLYRSGLRILESAADAKEAWQAIHKNEESKTHTPEGMESFEDFMLYEVGFFLISLSVENLLKAIWTAKNHSKIVNITHIRNDLKGLADHDLKRLAANAGVEISSDENALLDSLRDCILWYGRYPTPLKVSDYHESMTNGLPVSRFIEDGSIYSLELPIPREIANLIEKLMAELEAIPNEQTY